MPPVKRLGILTRDFRVLHELVRRLNSRGITYRVLDYGENVPPDVGAILTSWRDFTPRKGGVQRTIHGHDVDDVGPATGDTPIVSVRLAEDGAEDYERAIGEAMKALSGVERYERLVVGIDPGDHPGIAFLGDDVVVHTAHCQDTGEVIDHLKNFLPAFPAGEVVLRVGHGARLHRNRLLNDVLDLQLEGVRVEVVDETATNPVMTRRPSMHLTRDIQAAIGIGLQPGRAIERKVVLDVRRGEVADIQRKSRIASDGELTVDRALALRVARGELSMEDAIAAQRQRVRRKT